VTGGAAGATSGGILGLVLALIAQQFGYLDFSGLEQTLLLLILVIFVFAVVFGLLGRVMKGSAMRRAKAQYAASTGATPPAPGVETGVPPASPPPGDPGLPPSS
jgi:hypothetical protein